jgi:hypothetical protein
MIIIIMIIIIILVIIIIITSLSVQTFVVGDYICDKFCHMSGIEITKLQLLITWHIGECYDPIPRTPESNVALE